MITIGSNITEVEGANIEVEYFQNEATQKMKLSDLKGKWTVVVFYPADFTFVCPTELEELAELYPAFQKEGAEVLSVSTDTVFVHKAWHDKAASIKKINYPMVADPTGNLSRAFGVYMNNTGLALRGSFIIDPNGIVKILEINDLGIGRSGKELLRKLQAAKFVHENGDQVCPASWTPGAKTLKPGLDLVGEL